MDKNIKGILEKSGGLNREMKSRHVTMLAIGGTIGTGLFLGSGYVIQEAGALGSNLAYIFGGILMYIMMMCLGELVVAMPVAGSTQAYANEFISPTVGFISGWIRWLACAVTITSQLVASSIIMKNIIPSVPSYIWIIGFTALLVILNLFSSGKYGETEFWFAGIKLITIIIFIIIALGMLVGVVKSSGINIQTTINSSWLSVNFKNIILTIMTASFAYGGVDLIASAAGESEEPEKNLPKAINKSVFGLIGIYVISLFILSIVLPGQGAGLSGSPFAYIFKAAGLDSAELIINIVVVTSALSSANTFMFSCTRTLWSLGKHNQAFKFLGKVNKRKVPVYSLVVSIGFACLALISNFVSASKVYLFLISSIGASNMFLYAATCLCQYNFRKNYIKRGGNLSELKFKAPLFPLLPVMGIILYLLLVVVMIFEPTQRIALYSSIPIFIFIYIAYNIKERKNIKVLLSERANIQ